MVRSITKLIAGVIVLAGAVAGESASAVEKISIGDVGSGNATHWPVYIAQEKGFFRDAGVDVEYIPTQSSSQAIQQLTAGSVNMATSGLPDVLRAIDQGAAVRIMRIEVGPSPYEFYGTSAIKSVTDLAGKTVMIGGAKDVTRIYFEDMAKAKGLDPAKVDYIFAGSTSARFAALSSGSIAATILFPPFSFKAKSQGFVPLGRSADFTRDFPFTAYSVNQAWGQKNAVAVKGFLDGFARGIDWFYDPANRDEAIRIVVKATKADPADAADSYEFFQQIKAFERDGAVPRAGIEKLLKTIKDQGDLQGAPDFARFYDASIAPK
jgi:ABC-type nitrate/sulfonate/bicarbonate transport system substrate-binding protein